MPLTLMSTSLARGRSGTSFDRVLSGGHISSPFLLGRVAFPAAALFPRGRCASPAAALPRQTVDGPRRRRDRPWDDRRASAAIDRARDIAGETVAAEDLPTHNDRTCKGWARTWRVNAAKKQLKQQAVVVARLQESVASASPPGAPVDPERAARADGVAEAFKAFGTTKPLKPSGRRRASALGSDRKLKGNFRIGANHSVKKTEALSK